MSMCFRYKVRMATLVEIPEGGTATLVLSDFPEVIVSKFQAGSASITWVIFQCCGFATAEAAQVAGQRFGDILSTAGVLARLGIDIGFSRSTLQFRDEVHEAFRRQMGRELRADTHGLTTHEEGTVITTGLDARGSGTIPPKHLEMSMAEWCKPALSLTERLRNCAGLINDSFFVPNIEGQFILRISAVEALCDDTAVGDEYKGVVESLELHLKTLTMDATTRETVTRRLKDLKRRSLSQSYMEKFRTLLSADAAADYDRIYGLRSRLVHGGHGRGELGVANNDALNLGCSLIPSRD
jgi:hypothetical protein